MVKTSPIGIFDSGVGGLTVVKALIDKLPQESFVYFGDTAHLPYGNKTEAQLMGYAHDILTFLMKFKVKAVLVACGTHSSITLPHIAGRYPIPLLGVVKAGAKTAVQSTRNGKIGVIATQATINNHSYSREIHILNQQLQVFENACPRFVPLVEAGDTNGAETRAAIEEYIQPLLHQDIDTLVLGCTHYPFLEAAIQEYVGPKVDLVNPACETVLELIEELGKYDLLNDSDTAPERDFFVSGHNESFFTTGTRLLGNILQEVRPADLGVKS